MTDERNGEDLGKEVDRSMELVEGTLEDMLDNADVSRVYGEAIEVGDNRIIPTAEVLSFVGLGAGAGSGTSHEEEEGHQEGSGGGAGGGGRTMARPVAVVVASADGVRVEPVLDVTKIGLAALTAAGFMLAMVGRMTSPKRALKEMKTG